MAQRPKRCRICRRPATQKRRISRRGLCAECGAERYLSNLEVVSSPDHPENAAWREKVVQGQLKSLNGAG